MNDIYASIRLRPTRIGFLVKPTDMASVRKIMRACTCLWGGIYNPIIPVFHTSPKEWRPQKYDRIKGLAVTKKYIEFFEPDVFVESESGLLKKAGLGALQKDRSGPIPLNSSPRFLSGFSADAHAASLPVGSITA